jgi:hypothetical protein
MATPLERVSKDLGVGWVLQVQGQATREGLLRFQSTPQASTGRSLVEGRGKPCRNFATSTGRSEARHSNG